MSLSESIAAHYTQSLGKGKLLAEIEQGIETQLLKSKESVTVEELSATSADQFHVGGVLATQHLLDKLNLADTDKVIDVGCGFGGPARQAATKYRCSVVGIDLTPEYITVGTAINSWPAVSAQLSNRVRLLKADASSLDPTIFPTGSLDHGFMMHVGMNIPNKEVVARELFRVLKPGSKFVVYDAMAVCRGDSDGEDSVNFDANGSLPYPMPWASTPDQSRVSSPSAYLKAFGEAGFMLESRDDRTQAALDMFAATQWKMMQHFLFNCTSLPPQLGLRTLMGPSVFTKLGNYKAALADGTLALVEMVFVK